MIFDWFRRQSAPQPATAPAPIAPDELSDPGQPGSRESSAAADEVGSAPPAPASPVPASPAPVEAAVPAAPAVDQDALAWAREAYARLKAQQEAAKGLQEPTPAPEAAITAPPEPQADAEPQAPAEPTGVTASATASAVEPAPAPVAEPPPLAPELSLLEQAAAQRRERQQELLERPEPESSPASVSPAASATSNTSATTSPAADTATPQLGAFDEAFTWSVEVLAAQGVRADQVALEEIDWLGRLRRGLEKTRQGFVSQMLETLGDDPLTPEVLEQLETLLLRADVGVKATDQVLEALRQRLNQEVVDPGEGLRFLKEQLRGVLEAPIQASGTALLAPQRDRLNVWLLVGVNGVGKTTTLGKLANLAVRSGYSCLIAAADTFRAAAVQQVTVWGERSGVPVIANPSANADPAAVVFDAIGAASAKGTELVLVDTAGRLQTKHNLMEELSKVRRIVDRLAPQASVESLLVLDASQGQNGLRQAMAFASAAGLTGVVLTKLDGSARGGVALAVASEAGLPIRFVGAGEGIRDLRPFNSFEFVEALLAV